MHQCSDILHNLSVETGAVAIEWLVPTSTTGLYCQILSKHITILKHLQYGDKHHQCTITVQSTPMSQQLSTTMMNQQLPMLVSQHLLMIVFHLAMSHCLF